MKRYKDTLMKKALLIILMLLPMLGFNQDKVINITINQPASGISISGTASPTTGFGLANGSVNISVSGGSPGYTYSWSNGASSQDISGVPAGNYSVTVTDSKGCTASRNFTVTQPPQLTVSISSLSQVTCFGGSNGSLRANPSGGVPGYSYSWTKTGDASFSASTQTISGLTAGQYNVVVTDANGNTRSASRTVTQPTQIQYSVQSVTNVSCFGGNTGAINISVSGGISPYTVNWKDGATTEDRSNIPAGNYTFQITDAQGCTINNNSSPITVTQPSSTINITVPSGGIQNPTSNGGANGSININVSGGTPGYTYLWNTGATTQDLTNLSQGMYSVTVTDSNGCTESDSYTLTDPPPLIVNINLVQAIVCNGDRATLQAVASGGVPIPSVGYTYQWFQIVGGSPSPLGVTTSTINNLPEGEYRVVVTDNNGVTAQDTIIENEPPVLEFASVSSNNVLCFGGTDGSAGVVVSGGVPPYSYSWTKTGDASFSANSQTITNINAGDYSIEVTDNKGCVIVRSFTITEPSTAVTITSSNIIDVGIAGQNTGAIDISVSGGTPGYTYQWTKTGDATFNETNQDLNNVGVGEYTVTVRDTNVGSSSNTGCIATATYTISEPPVLVVDATVNLAILCFNDGNGELIANVSGGVGGYTYEWFQIVGGTPVSLNLTTSIIGGLSGGEYEVRVRDTNGALASDTVVLNEPDELMATLVEITDVACFGASTGAIDINVTGGTGPYTYRWFDDNGQVLIFTQDLSNIPVGNYRVDVLDTNNCTTSLGSMTVSQPTAALSISDVSITHLTGFETNNGSISVTVVGGEPGYTYEWRVEGTSTVIDNTPTINNLQAGNYELTLSDTTGCTIIEVYTVTQPDLLEISTIDETNSILCFGDSTAVLEATVTGGVPAYQYSWYNVTDNTTILSTNNILNDVPAGVYVLEVSDVNGNQTSQNYTINQPAELLISFVKTDVSCNGGNDGSIDITVVGGTGAYSYFWSNGANTEDVSGLLAGNYTITVRDQNNCETMANISISEPAEAVNVTNVVIENTTGNGLTNGSITIDVAGGTPGYGYRWEDANNTVLSSTTNILDNVGAGSYFVTVTDANGCVLGPIEYVVNEPLPITINIIETSVPCFGETGELTADVSGGVPPYSYRWFDNTNSEISTNVNTGAVVSGTYRLEVTDANANQEIRSNIILSQPNVLEITNIVVSDVTCYNGSNGNIEVTVAGGTGTYIYNWSNSGSNSNIINGLAAGNYSVTITDENGCSVTSNVIEVNQPSVYDVISANLIRPSGGGTPDGSISIEIVGGVSPYDYVWRNSGGIILQQDINQTVTANSISGLQEGTYNLVVTDALGCTIDKTYNLADPGELLVSIDQIQPISCNGGSDGILEVITIGGAGGNSYAWYDAATDTLIGTSVTLTGVAVGSYYVIVSNADGIQEQSAVFVVSEPNPVSGIIANTVIPDCFGTATGSITITGSGGNGNYEYRYRLNGGSYSTWIPFTSTNTTIINGLIAGFYEIQVMDTNGCFYEESGGIGVLSVAMTEPSELMIDTVVLNDPTGFGLTNGSISVTPIGGTVPYNYQWFDISNTTLGNTETLSGIGVGDYTVVVTDANGCQIQQTYTLNQPDELLVSIEIVNIISCNQDLNGSLRAMVQGGVGPQYTYEWFATGNTGTIGNLQLQENLGAGTYYVFVTDTNGNTAQSADFIFTEPDELSLVLFSDYVLCGDGSDWEINASITGGTPPYSYSWSNGASTDAITNVLPGDYELTITDSNGCQATSNIQLIPPPPITVSETVIDATCFGGADGSINISANGGTPPYSYSWNNGGTSNAISGLTAGTYEVTITDSKGCQFVQSYTVGSPPMLIVDLGEDVTLCTDQTYVIDATIDEGVTYQWTSTNGFTSDEAIIEVAAVGIYTVTITNAQGCIATDSIFIDRTTDVVSAQFIMSTQVFTGEQFIIVNISDPKPDIVEWIFPPEATVAYWDDNYAELIFDTAGEYDITIVTNRGLCSASQTKTIVVLDREIENGENNPGDEEQSVIEFTVYPNPTTDGRFSVEVKVPEIQPVSIRVFNMVNNTLVDFREDQGQDEYLFTYDISFLPSGIFFIVLETSSGSQVRKLVKQ